MWILKENNIKATKKPPAKKKKEMTFLKGHFNGAVKARYGANCIFTLFIMGLSVLQSK